jgi:hypothetical protein
MKQGTNTKLVNVLPPNAIIDNAAGTTNVIDCIGFDHCTIIFQLGAMDIAMTSLKVQEADAAASGTALTSPTDVSGTVVGTDTDAAGAASVLPSATGDNGIVVFEIDCKIRKRYLDLVAAFGDGAAGTYASALAILSRAEQPPVTAAGRGAALLMVA